MPSPGTNSRRPSAATNNGASRDQAGTPAAWNCFFRLRGGVCGARWKRSPPRALRHVAPCSNANGSPSLGAARSHAQRRMPAGARGARRCSAAQRPDRAAWANRRQRAVARMHGRPDRGSGAVRTSPAASAPVHVPGNSSTRRSSSASATPAASCGRSQARRHSRRRAGDSATPRARAQCVVPSISGGRSAAATSSISARACAACRAASASAASASGKAARSAGITCSRRRLRAKRRSALLASST